MVGVLLDTCVLIELQRPQGNNRVRAHVDELEPEQLFLSVISVGEMAQGIARQAPGARRQELTTWLLRLEQRFAARILPVDGDVAWKWGELTAYTQSRGAQVPAADGLIAATALRHGLHVMTRNVRQFALTGTTIINPWEDEA